MQIERQARELEEARQQQAASSRVLHIIGGSPGALTPVFQAILKNAVEVCGARFGGLFKMEGNLLHLVADYNLSATQRRLLQALYPMMPNLGHVSGRAILTRSTVQIPDTNADEDYKGDAKKTGFRSLLATPLLKSDRAIGSIVIYKAEPGMFPARQLNLLQNFAAQAVIAIENARLFDETREALERQTATADVLKVISRSTFDLPPVLDTLISSACRLCEADLGAVRYQDGPTYRVAADYGSTPGWRDHLARQPSEPGRGSIFGRTVVDRRTIHIPDVLADPEYTRLATQKVMGYRAALGVPLIREGRVIGVLNLFRFAPGPFTEKQIELVETFADQAVIAIENVRLFNATKEALERQTATADILKVIASSPSDVQPVFEAMVASANRLIGGYATAVIRFIDGYGHLAAFTPINPDADEKLKAAFPQRIANVPMLRPAQAGEVLQIVDTEKSHERLRDIARARGFRSVLYVPLKSKETSIGVIATNRRIPGPFSAHDVQLLQTFADQAVIAIENVRLFEEVQAKTRDLTESLEQQTATADVLKVISASVGELEPVFKAMLVNAVTICDARFGSLYLYDGDLFTAVAFHNAPPEFAEARFGKALHPPPDSALGLVLATNQLAQVEDITTTKSYRERRDPFLVSSVNLAGFRTVLSVPLLKNDKLIGAININRQEVRPFTDKQIALMQNFAAQAVIAIENARLFSALRQRTDDLTKSLEDLRTAQDRLIQTEKLASLGQLTAGIAHEIKNPLNFVNNFSALSAELTDELNDILKSAALGEKMRGEVDELTGLLKDNLEKVVQHGKRADSIVKNMLLHSREGSREHRPADINSLLDESLNLAYHGARAEKGEFNITLQRDFDSDAGTIEVFPQEITRAFLNLIANGVYAVTWRKNEEKEPGFEPTLRAATKNLGTTVEIRIRDNGTGIPAEVREKMFNPFFTTKPAGEGTGLGLSMTHDIIVKQHGGRIDVATELGQFTEFTIVLPRNSNLSDRDRGKA